MSKLFLTMWLFSLVVPNAGIVCPIYDQALDSNGRLDVYDLPSRVGQMNGCLVCMAMSNGSHVQFDCVMSMNDKGHECLQSEQSSPFNCLRDHEFCCCRTVDCFDRLRFHWSSNSSSRKDDTTCTVNTYFLNEVISEEPPALIPSSVPPIQHTSDNETIIDTPKLLSASSKFEVTDGTKNETRRFVRSTCGVCLAHYRGTDELDTICVEHGDVEDTCHELTEFVGGALACNHKGTKCCCKGSTCDSDFALKFLGYQLPIATVSTAYSSASYLRPSELFLLTMIYGLLC
ncbi:hypothetical protein M3Y94_00597100 [Aphelenchoides besseyi]|nr:hypothetical protein M3Y94_00597100 [Aphelenchoides besseyi]KAI6222186.1 hypothetical protein M3Y95_00957900 [Aphelenchoides besseyi]